MILSDKNILYSDITKPKQIVKQVKLIFKIFEGEFHFTFSQKYNRQKTIYDF